MIRCYRLKDFGNKNKLGKLSLVVSQYRKTAISVAKDQWNLFYKTGRINKFSSFGKVSSKLSARYLQTIRGQVVSQLDSFITNQSNLIKKLIGKSSLSKETKQRLFIINKYKMWFYEDNYTLKSGFILLEEDLRLSRKLFHRASKINNKPDFSNCNMVLDSKVCSIEAKQETEKKKAKSFDIWLKISTLEKGKPILIPLKTNTYVASKKGVLKKIVQINERNGNFTFSIVKDIAKRPYNKTKNKIGLDLGFKSFLYTNKGDMFGKVFIDKLKSYQEKITKLRSARNKCGLKYSTGKLKRLEEKLRTLIKNEVNRIINRILKIYSPNTIVIEKLDFRSSNLGKRLNRILSRFGKTILKQKLDSIKEEFGVKIVEVNPAYTSQTCSHCGYVHKNNRKGDSFSCKYCGKSLNADINASRNILDRSSIKELESIYLKRDKILSILLQEFRERNCIKTRLNSWSEVSNSIMSRA